MMPKLSRRTLLLSIALLTFVALYAPALCPAQTVTYDWETKGDKPEANLAPFRERRDVRIVIRNVNNILFNYSITVNLTPVPYDDWALVARFFRPASAAKAALDRVPPKCAPLALATTDLTTVTGVISTSNKLPIGYGRLPAGQQTSVPLSESLEVWNNEVRGPLQSLRENVQRIRSQCDTKEPTIANFLNEYGQFELSILKIEANVNSSHITETTVGISPGTDAEVTVRELFNRRPEPIYTATFKFRVESGVLTLSAGAIFSKIQDRRYEPSKFPGMTQNVLVVQGNSRVTPGIVALLNYSLPFGLDRDDYGFAIAAGPIVRFGNQSDTSSFGFFTGISGHIQRLYITPGLSFTQFADFPVGFSNGSTIPENFGQLIPVKRWTTRFGLAITFKTTNFDNLGADETTASVDKKPAPAASPTPQPSPDSNSTLNPISSKALAGHVRTNTGNLQDKQVSISDLYVSSSLESPSALRTVSLVNGETPDAVYVMINSKAEVQDYKIYSENGRLYIVIPNAELGAGQGMPGTGSLKMVKAERRGTDLVLVFVWPPGLKPRVQEKNNRLDVLFIK